MGEDPGTIRNEIEETRGRMGDTVDALAYKADVKSRAKDSMTDKVDTLKSKITGATDSVTESTPGTGDVRAKRRQAVGIAAQNPLGLAAGAVAVGFVAGMLIPSTRVEDERLGPVADQVKDRAAETGQQVLEHGKQVAHDVAETGRGAVGQAVHQTKEAARQSGREHGEEVAREAQGQAGTAREQVRSSP
jgi:phage tail protein X